MRLKAVFGRNLAARLKRAAEKPVRLKVWRQSETGQAPSLHEFIVFPRPVKPALRNPEFEISCAWQHYFTLPVDSRTINSGTILR
jgi:hypothetical protein